MDIFNFKQQFKHIPFHLLFHKIKRCNQHGVYQCFPYNLPSLHTIHNIMFGEFLIQKGQQRRALGNDIIQRRGKKNRILKITKSTSHHWRNQSQGNSSNSYHSQMVIMAIQIWQKRSFDKHLLEIPEYLRNLKGEIFSITIC